MASGDDGAQGSMALHLLILRLLQPALSTGSPVRALDIGAGTGWLLKAFALMNGDPHSKILGMDIHGFELANQILADPCSVSGTTHGAQPFVIHGDLLKEDFGIGASVRAQLLPCGGFDALNVGIAVSSDQSVEFKQIVGLLADGGYATVPICSSTPQQGKCNAELCLYRRAIGPEGPKLEKVRGGFFIKIIMPEPAM